MIAGLNTRLTRLSVSHFVATTAVINLVPPRWRRLEPGT
jgi:hypothetical protein